jgi:lipoate-protein ligase A
MILYETASNDPYYNLACEEYLLRNSEDDIFMLWQNQPVVVIGQNQNMYAEVNLEYTEPRGIVVARRITGGGAVYHDLGNVNYSFITSKEKAQVLDFAYFTEPIIRALASMGVEAVLSGRNDLLADGAKFSGNAQYATKDRILHHGTLLFDSDLSVLAKTLKPDEEKLRSKAIPSVRSRVTNLKPLIGGDMTTAEFFGRLEAFILDDGRVPLRIADRTAVLASGLYDRNRSEDYICGRRETYAYRVRRRCSGGIVTLLFDTREGALAKVRFEGDFFGREDVREAETKLQGCPLQGKTLEETLRALPMENYISGLCAEDMRSMIEEALGSAEQQ